MMCRIIEFLSLQPMTPVKCLDVQGFGVQSRQTVVRT